MKLFMYTEYESGCSARRKFSKRVSKFQILAEKYGDINNRLALSNSFHRVVKASPPDYLSTIVNTCCYTMLIPRSQNLIARTKKWEAATFNCGQCPYATTVIGGRKSFLHNAK